MNEFRILLVDDDQSLLESMADSLIDRDYQVSKAASAEEALKILAKGADYDLAIIDLVLPGINGIDLLRKISGKYDEMRLIVITGHGSVATAVDAMKLGAIDYLEKPVNPHNLLMVVKREHERRQLVDQSAYFMAELSKQYNIENIVGGSPAMLKVFKKVKDISDSDSTVLITGESGTGKELIAHHVHYNSRRRTGPIVKVSCASLAQGVLESELFGHEKGSFTGAIRTKPGRFEMAHGGTLFLDEVGDIPLHAQAKLLRVLQTMEFERVGGTKQINTDFRLICATNQDLKQNVQEGIFREDFFYRINVIEIALPPLSERKDDIPILVNYFIELYSHQTNKGITGIHDEAMAMLNSYHWPGNVRELKNVIESASVYCQGAMIDLRHLPQHLQTAKVGTLNLSQLPTRSLIEIEKDMIALCLWEAEGNKAKAAEKLGISRPTLYDKLKKYNLSYQK
jgi:DNA-binding NtrC family response regulator